jgi:general secretion pathway protein D
MKNHKRNRLAWATLAAAVAVGSLVAQDVDPVTQKTQLLSEALAAREKGDLQVALEKFEQIQKISKDDEAAKEGIASVKAALAAADKAKADAEAAKVKAAQPAPVAPAKPATLLDEVAASHDNLYREVAQAIALAKQTAEQGDYAGALKVLDGANGALPNNTAAQNWRDEIALAKQDIVSRRESGDQGADQLARSEVVRLAKINAAAIDAASVLIDEAESSVRKGELDEATALLDKASANLPRNIATKPVSDRIKSVKSSIISRRAFLAMDAREMNKADAFVREFERLNGADDASSRRLRAEFASKKSDPAYRSVDEISPGLRAKDDKVQELLVKGRARYLYGDYAGALDAYREILQYQPNNAESKAFQVRIRQVLSENSGQWNRNVSKGKLLELLDESWKLPEVYNREVAVVGGSATADPVLDKLRSITVPEINIRDLPFDRAIAQLTIVSQSYDKENKGVNMFVIDPDRKNPSVNMTLRNVTLEKAIDLITKQVNFTYTINSGIIEIRPDSGSNDLETEFFPLSSAAETKMTGIGTGAPASSTPGATASPFGGATAGAGATDVNPRNEGIKNFLTRSGVSFEVTGAVLNYDGTTLIVTQNRKNLERIRNILRRYSDIKQVHIESKFIEVSESSLNELSTNLRLSKTVNGVQTIRAQTNLRSVNDVFGSATVSNPGSIAVAGVPGPPALINGQYVYAVGESSNTPIANNPPNFPAGNFGGREPNFGGAAGWNGAAGAYNGMIGTIGSYDLSIFLKAIEQSSGSDLMSAPSLTVLDGKTAIIKIAQLLRYPQSYGDTQSNVGSSGGNQNGGGSAGVTITAGTPQDFTVQEVGVTLEVTPTVGADDSIALNLKPKVTEFEGFVEYGGTSVAISSGTTVTIPSGFFQPIFTTREVSTDVTVFDGATVVIGGLTREEVKTVNDKVPVLGDIPLIGAAFRSSGKSTIKKNLTVFVTANLVSPGGATLRSSYPGMRAGSVFQNPVVLSPGGAVYREPVEATPTNSSPREAAPAAPAAGQ